MKVSSTLPGISVALLATITGCVNKLPPITPDAVMPKVDPLPPPPVGQGYLVIDTVEGRFGNPTNAPVEQVTYEADVRETDTRPQVHFRASPRLLCQQTPCAVPLPLGNVALRFAVTNQTDFDTELVNIGPDPTVYRRRLSHYQDDTGTLHILGMVGAPLGFVGAVTGGVILGYGVDQHRDGATIGGAVTLGSSVIMFALSMIALKVDAPTLRPGAANHFPLSQ